MESIIEFKINYWSYFIYLNESISGIKKYNKQKVAASK